MSRSENSYNWLGAQTAAHKALTIAARAQAIAAQRARLVDRLLAITTVDPEGGSPRRAPELGKLDRQYVQLLGEAVLRITRKSPNKARAGLRALADQLDRGRGRYGLFADFNAELAVALRAYAACLPFGDVGNPNEPQSLATKRVGQILDELNALAKRTNFVDWENELAQPGNAGVPSRGRKLVAQIFESRFGADRKGRTAAELVRQRLTIESKAQRRAQDRFIKYWTNWLRCN